MTREAIILAGGLGTRLRAVIADKPKVMAPIGKHPFLYYLLHYLADQGVRRVVLALGYQHQYVLQWLNQSASHPFPFEITPVVEPSPLGTGGAIRLSMHQTTAETIFVLNGDTYFPISLSDMEQLHRRMKNPSRLQPAICRTPVVMVGWRSMKRSIWLGLFRKNRNEMQDGLMPAYIVLTVRGGWRNPFRKYSLLKKKYWSIY